MKKPLPKWLNDAIDRIRAESYQVLIHTEEDIKKYQEMYDIGRPLKVGDTVIIRTPRPFVVSETPIDDFFAERYARVFLIEHPEYR